MSSNWSFFVTSKAFWRKAHEKLIKNAKRNYEKRLASGNGGSNRSFYSYVRQRTKSRPSIGPLRNEKREMVSDDQGMTELLNNFFGSVFTREDTTNIPAAKEMEMEIEKRRWKKEHCVSNMKMTAS
jgi:hypothetical protein